jgi:hypothetical protein
VERLDRESERIFYEPGKFYPYWSGKTIGDIRIRKKGWRLSDSYCDRNTRLNGYLCRDDVSWFFLRDQRIESPYAKLGEFDARELWDSDYKKYGEEENTNHDNWIQSRAQMTQDQIAHLLMGLALVQKCMHDASTGGFDYVAKAREIAMRTAHFMSSSTWRIKLDGLVMDHGGYTGAQLNYFGFQEAFKHFGYKLNGKDKWLKVYYHEYKPAWQRGLDFRNWDTQTRWHEPIEGEKIKFTHQYIPSLYLSLATIGNSVIYINTAKRTGRLRDKCGWLACFKQHEWCYPGTGVCRWSNAQFINPFYYNLTLDGRKHKSAAQRRFVNMANSGERDLFFYPLFHAYLHDEVYRGDYQQIEDALNEAPYNGTYYYSANSTGNQNSYNHPGVYGWRSKNRFEKPADAKKDYQDVSKDGFRGEYAGLDYMLLHNLYYLQAGQDRYPGEIKNRYNITVGPNTINSTNKDRYDQIYAFDEVHFAPDNSTGTQLVQAGERIMVEPLPGQDRVILNAGQGSLGLANNLLLQTKPTEGNNLRFDTRDYPVMPSHLNSFCDGGKIANTTTSNTVDMADSATYHAWLQHFQDSVFNTIDHAEVLAETEKIYTYQPLDEYLAERNGLAPSGRKQQTNSTLKPLELAVSPNPNNGRFLLSCKTPTTGILDYAIVDQAGKVVRTGSIEMSKGHNLKRIDLGHLLSGGVFRLTGTFQDKTGKEHFDSATFILIKQ